MPLLHYNTEEDSIALFISDVLATVLIGLSFSTPIFASKLM
jgi:hypothetical protein